jgi:hypothetical protein
MKFTLPEAIETGAIAVPDDPTGLRRLGPRVAPSIYF